MVESKHIVIDKLIKMQSGGKIKPNEKQMNLVSDIFKFTGGSWFGFFSGDYTDIVLLKKIIKTVLRLKILEKHK